MILSRRCISWRDGDGLLFRDGIGRYDMVNLLGLVVHSVRLADLYNIDAPEKDPYSRSYLSVVSRAF